MTWWLIAGGILLIWVMLHLKTSRPDGTLVKKLHPYRRIMSYIMPTKAESVVYFDEYINAEPLLDYIKQANERFSVGMTHCLVSGISIALLRNPMMNRFIAGHRLYERKGSYITFSMKRKKLNKKAKIAVVKQEITSQMTFRELCTTVSAKIDVERSDKKTYVDKELSLFNVIPRPILSFLTKVFNALNYYNLLPGSFIKNDGMFSSVFLANLGSLGLNAGYHHLYEWGTCPLFLMAGQIHDRPVLKNGVYQPQKTLHIRFTFDERIDDGLTAGQGMATFKHVLEHPFEYLGCLKEDASDARPFGKSDAILEAIGEGRIKVFSDMNNQVAPAKMPPPPLEAQA